MYKLYGICSCCGFEIYVPLKKGLCPTCQKLDPKIVKIKKRTRYTKRKRGKFYL